MGEAKRRGTYEERKAQAIERDKNKPKLVRRSKISKADFASLLYFPFMTSELSALDGMNMLFHKRR